MKKRKREEKNKKQKKWKKEREKWWNKIETSNLEQAHNISQQILADEGPHPLTSFLVGRFKGSETSPNVTEMMRPSSELNPPSI